MGKWTRNLKNEPKWNDKLKNAIFETFIVDKNLENSEYIIHSFQTNYQ